MTAGRLNLRPAPDAGTPESTGAARDADQAEAGRAETRGSDSHTPEALDTQAPDSGVRPADTAAGPAEGEADGEAVDGGDVRGTGAAGNAAGDARHGGRRAAEEAGRRQSARPAASLLEIAPKPRRRPAAAVDPAAGGSSASRRPGLPPEPVQVPGLPTTGKRDLTDILRALNDPAAGEIPLGPRPASVDPASATRAASEADAGPAVTDAECQDAALPDRSANPPPVVRLTAVAPPPAQDDVPAFLEPDFTDVKPAPVEADAEEDLPLVVFEDAEADDAGLGDASATASEEGPEDGDQAGAGPAPDPDLQPAPAEARSRSATPPTPASADGPSPAGRPDEDAEPRSVEARRFGWRGLAARAARVVAGSRSREADAVARRQEAVVAAVRQRDEALALRPAAPAPLSASVAGPPAAAAPQAATSKPEAGLPASTVPAGPSGMAEAEPATGSAAPSAADGDGIAGSAAKGAPAQEAVEPPVALLRRGEGGLVGARRLRPGPRGPEDLIRLWLERRGTKTVPAWSSFPAATVGAQWPNSLLLTVDPEAAPDGDAAAAFAAIVRLDRADWPRPADAPRIVYTPTMTEWILALSREAARSSRMLRDRDEFMTSDGRLSLTLVALPMGEVDGTVDKVLCHLAADPS